MSNKMKDIQFPSVNYDDWKEQAIKALKGKPFETLFSKTIEGVTLEPLYTQEMLVEKMGGQLEKQISTIRSLKMSATFLAAQQIYGKTPEQFFSNIQDSLNRGNDVLTIDSRMPFEWNDDSLSQLVNYISENSFKFYVQNENDSLLKVFNKIDDSNKQKINGFIISETPVTLEGFEKVRTYSANTVTYHNDGANAIQELAIALALAAKYAQLEENFEDFTKKYFVNFAVDTQFFSEIAKLRAFKVLWKAFSSAYGFNNPSAIPVFAETSLRSFSKLDVYVNLLRAGNEAFAALIGGADLITVHPHDVLSEPTEQSIRIARNVLLVLKEESFVADVLDPSGGSYFIESLTAEYVEKAWQLFIEIEDAGGIDAFSQSGKLQAAIEEVYNSRLKAVETRKHSLIGTNIYANPVDELPLATNPQHSQIKRLAIPFENLREKYNEVQPSIAILTIGKLKNFKARADFVAGFFATAGIILKQSGEIETIEDAIGWLKQVNYDYVIVAGNDEDTKSLIPSILAQKPKNLILDVAGKFKEEETEWLNSGLNGFIFAGQNLIVKLKEVLESLKGVQR
ncbi:methylmalonyl-CoA mutase family protein [Lysinibacillus telephonicus]|uniref:Methylmalonyl-CoA mutase n=1 Tax=Lysinibacillus telephonicus TaxID=1714840 RepID=A0A431USJ8_9BACI|nr:methylmalonyl-CoA mutase family protein [Lysinibacillus telephonicus]RTQ93476.1 methylmalonyl-CoA mutase [Lysinibacillus telephonicus]